jgi:phosphoribosylformylglycinamidine synthase subunit PurL
VLEANGRGLVSAAHDLGDGGLAVAAAEMALAGGIGVTVAADATLPALGWFFGEDQGRYLVATREKGALLGLAAERGVPARVVGEATASEAVVLGTVEVGLDALRQAHEGALPALLEG